MEMVYTCICVHTCMCTCIKQMVAGLVACPRHEIWKRSIKEQKPNRKKLPKRIWKEMKRMLHGKDLCRSFCHVFFLHVSCPFSPRSLTVYWVLALKQGYVGTMYRVQPAVNIEDLFKEMWWPTCCFKIFLCQAHWSRQTYCPVYRIIELRERAFKRGFGARIWGFWSLIRAEFLIPSYLLPNHTTWVKRY